MDKELTVEQIAALEGMIARRMNNTNETREQVCAHLVNYLEKRAEDP